MGAREFVYVELFVEKYPYCVRLVNFFHMASDEVKIIHTLK